MITNWTIENFKSIYDSATFKLSPLTIFAGANSSGKSTVLQSILLIAQTLQSSVQSKSVILNGHIVRLGAYNDIASNSCQDKDISIGFTIAPTAESSKVFTASQTVGIYSFYSNEHDSVADTITCQMSFGCDGDEAEKEALQLQPRLKTSSVKVVYKDQFSGRDTEVKIAASRSSLTEKAIEFKLPKQSLSVADLASLAFDVIKPQNYKSRRRNFIMDSPNSGTPAGAVPAHFLPARMSIVYDTVQENTNNIFEVLLNARQGRHVDESLRRLWTESLDDVIQGHIIEFLEKCVENLATKSRFTLGRVSRLVEHLKSNFSFEDYQNTLSALPEESRRLYTSLLIDKSAFIIGKLKYGKKSDYRMTFVPLSAPADFAVTYVRNYFGNQLKYLGPLRDEPKPVYPLSGTTDPKDVGFRGEHTAAVLDIHKHTMIYYIASSDLGAFTSEVQLSQATLLNAVADWLNYLGVVSDVKTTDKGKLGHELQVSTDSANDMHDLTHVGVGVSQVLPILVMALLAEPDAVLVFEQPELHLHPRVQTRLADFFVSMNILKKQCIVETHSEYLINRLRYLSAVSEGKKVSSDTIIYFVEKMNGHSSYRPIEINSQGVIEDWPKGFFDESEEISSALLQLAIERRKILKRGQE